LLTYDAVVVGLGGMGSATLAALATRKRRVLGIEQFERGHDRGSSTGDTRIIRKAYFEEPSYIPLLQHAYDRWAAIERVSGRELFVRTGVLLAAAPNVPSLANAHASARTYGIPHELLDAEAIRRRFPRLSPRDDELGLFETDAGFVRPEATIDTLIDLALGAGAEARFMTAVVGWDARADGTIAVELDDGTQVAAARLAICMGPWFAAVARAIGLPLHVERRVQHWFAPAFAGAGPDAIPTFLVDRAEQPSRMYGFPDIGGGVKAAFHGVGERTDPDALDRAAHPGDVEPLRASLDGWIPAAGADHLRSKVCMYTLTPDENFVIGTHPQSPNVVIAGGFSGHGFKFVPAIGDIVADLVVEGGTALPIAFLDPRRFER
jgi:sarcosine oxidase